VVIQTIFAAAIRELNSSNPGHEDMLSAQSATMVGELTKFSAFDFGPGAVANYFRRNVNIIKDQVKNRGFPGFVGGTHGAGIGESAVRD